MCRVPYLVRSLIESTTTMSTTLCTLWLLASVSGAEPPGIAHVNSPAIVVRGDEVAQAEERARYGTNCCEPLPFVYRGCHRPAPLVYVDTACTLRWYTMLNAAQHLQPYNYLVQFDYPWHRESSCIRVGMDQACPNQRFESHASLAPLAPTEGAYRGGVGTSRPSAIRIVD